MLVTGLIFCCGHGVGEVDGANHAACAIGVLAVLAGIWCFLLPMIRDLRSATVTPRQWKLFGLRGFLHAFGVMLVVFCHDAHPDRGSDGDELSGPGLRLDRGRDYSRGSVWRCTAHHGCGHRIGGGSGHSAARDFETVAAGAFGDAVRSGRCSRGRI